VLTFEGRAGLWPVLKSAVKDAPFALALPGLAYSVQNILYFEALSHLSVASYQVLSQSKLLFTGLFMSIILKHRLSRRQFLALVLLMIGTILTQLSEMSRSAITGGNAVYGGLLALGGAALSALPNVYYEKVLKTEGHNLWSKNIQLSFWIWFWLVVISLPSVLSREGIYLPSRTTMMTGITASVWLVIVTNLVQLGQVGAWLFARVQMERVFNFGSQASKLSTLCRQHAMCLLAEPMTDAVVICLSETKVQHYSMCQMM